MSDQETLLLRSKLIEYLANVSRILGIELKLDDHGMCFFKHDTSRMEFVIELPENSDVVYFYSPICRVPYDHTEQFFEKLLENNLHGVANRQASFGLDNKTQNIVLTFSIPMRHIDAVSLNNIVNNFIKVAEHAAQNTRTWISEIEKTYSLSDEEISAADDLDSHDNLKIKV